MSFKMYLTCGNCLHQREGEFKKGVELKEEIKDDLSVIVVVKKGIKQTLLACPDCGSEKNIFIDKTRKWKEMRKLEEIENKQK